jgi:hypothetical protein
MTSRSTENSVESREGEHRELRSRGVDVKAAKVAVLDPGAKEPMSFTIG